MRGARSISLVIVVVAAAVCAAGVGQSVAVVVISGTSGAKYLISGMPVATTATPAVFKIAFENKSSETDLLLCAGTTADFADSRCALILARSGGPGIVLLTIVDAKTLDGKIIYVIRSAGTADSQFVLTIE